MINHSIHNVMRSTLALAKFSALFCAGGIHAKDSSKLRFKWFSLGVFYWLLVWVGLTYLLYRIWMGTHFREPNGSLSAITNSTLLRSAAPPLIFYILFLQMSCKWPSFVQEWESVEKTMVLHQSDRQVHRKVFLSTLTFTAMRFTFYSASMLMTALRVAQCLKFSSVADFVHVTFFVRFSQVFSVTPGAYWKYFCISFVELCSNFSWLCVDLVILDLSLVLRSKLVLFNRHLKRCKIKASSSKFWQMTRQEFCKLSHLSTLTDSILSPLIFAFVVFETMDITLLLYMTLTNSFSFLSYIFYLIVFVSHLAPDVWTLVAMVTILEEGKKPLLVLRQLPTRHMTIEAKRFYLQLKRSSICLTGCKFFVVTHSLMLSIISTLITYEVLLVQLGGLKHPEPNLEDTKNDISNTTALEYCSWVQNYIQNKH